MACNDMIQAWSCIGRAACPGKQSPMSSMAVWDEAAEPSLEQDRTDVNDSNAPDQVASSSAA